VNSKRSSVDGTEPINDIAVLVDEDQVRDADLREMHRQRVQPEVVGEDRVAHRDVTCDALVIAAVCEAAYESQ
jgi:hypothetical protein